MQREIWYSLPGNHITKQIIQLVSPSLWGLVRAGAKPLQCEGGWAAKLHVWVFTCCNGHINLPVLLRYIPGWKGGGLHTVTAVVSLETLFCPLTSDSGRSKKTWEATCGEGIGQMSSWEQ